MKRLVKCEKTTTLSIVLNQIGDKKAMTLSQWLLLVLPHLIEVRQQIHKNTKTS